MKSMLCFIMLALQQPPADKPGIIMPMAPAPALASAPLHSSQLYVIRFTEPLIVVASPDGVVSITDETGPLRIRGIFFDGNGKTETKNFKEPFVYIVEAVSPGHVEVMVWKVGSKSRDEIIRRQFDVTVSPAPAPPKPPDPQPPDPKPDPPKPGPPTPKVDKLAIVVVWESANSTPEVAKVMKDLQFWQSLEKDGHRWYQIDKDQLEADGKTLIIDAKKYRKYVEQHGVPVVIMMAPDGGLAASMPLPKTQEELRTKIKQVTGR